MATTSEVGWRVKTMIILMVVITMMYTSYGFFKDVGMIDYSIYQNDDALFDNASTSGAIGNGSFNESYEYDTTQGQSFIDIIGGIGDFLTFGAIGDGLARLFLSTVVVICYSMIAIIIYTFVRDWVPFV